jgi:hypothetical protein
MGTSVDIMEHGTTITRRGRYVGEVVYMFAFDVAYEMTRHPVRELLGQPAAQYVLDSSKRNPRHLFFYRPQMVRLPAQERLGPHGPVRVEFAVKLLPVGAISITVRVPFAVQHVEDLIVYHDLQFSNGSLSEEVRRLAQQVREELRPYYIRPVKEVPEEEAYTVFCLEAPVLDRAGVPQTTETWLNAHRRHIAALLTQEPEIERLSVQESEESTVRALSYYEHDLVVVDWDAALVIDKANSFDETLYVMELANLQLAELEAYDRLLDDALERSYRDLSERRIRSQSDVLREVREIRIDLARFSDELQNITKFFGDWHVARIYEAIAARFHLPEWHRSIDTKLRTLDNLYQLCKADQNNRWMLILEFTIVLLFVIDLVMLFFGMKP